MELSNKRHKRGMWHFIGSIDAIPKDRDLFLAVVTGGRHVEWRRNITNCYRRCSGMPDSGAPGRFLRSRILDFEASDFGGLVGHGFRRGLLPFCAWLSGARGVRC